MLDPSATTTEQPGRESVAARNDFVARLLLVPADDVFADGVRRDPFTDTWIQEI